MRALIIAHSTKMDAGATKSLLTLISGLMSKGVSLYVITPDKDGLYTFLSNKQVIVKAVNLRMNVYPDLHTLKDYILFIPRIIARQVIEHKAVLAITDFCRENKIQLIHSNVGLLSCGLTAARQLGIPHILHIREFGDKDFGYKYYPAQRSFYNKIKTCNSYFICITKGIQDYHGLSGDRCRQIYNGIDFTFHDGHSEYAGQSFYLYAGRIEQAKGTLQLLEAFSKFCSIRSNRDTRLLLAGSVSNNEYFQTLQSFITASNLSDKVVFLGSRPDVDTLMRDAIAIIVPSVSEAFGRCLPEAMLNKCLTIGRNTGGTKEQYDNGLKLFDSEIGLRYETTEELANLLCEVSDTLPASYEKMKQNAYDTVKKLYNKQQYIDSVYELYTQIINTK